MFRPLRLAVALAALGLCAATAHASDTAKPYTRNVAILIYPGVEILDFAGPSEVFASAAGIAANGSQRAFRCYLVARTKDLIVSQSFIHVTPNYSIDDCPKPDILVFPGGGSGVVTSDSAWMAWIRKASSEAENVLTVCTGAFIAGRAGLLEGQDATTWYDAIPALTKNYPNTRVFPGRRFVDNGKLITTAGVSAGIDGSLHFVARELGQYVANKVAEYMEYRWTPEAYLSKHYPQLNPRLDERGRAVQAAQIANGEGHADIAVAGLRALVGKQPADADTWLLLGEMLHGQKRYPEAIQAHLEAAKAEALRARANFNLACEYSLTGNKDKAVEAAQRAVDAGYRQQVAYQTDEELAAIRDDARFKAMLAKM